MQEPTTDRLLDVVEDFECPMQSDLYHIEYRKWRRAEKNHYAFRCTKNPKEASFSESKAVINETPSQMEHGVIQRIGYLIGCLFVLYLVVENVLDKIIVFVMNALGMRVQMLFWGSDFYGDEMNVFLVILLINTLKFLLPAVILQLILRLPLRVGVPLRLRQPHELLLGISLTMLLSAGLGIFLVSSSSEMEKYKLIFNAVGVEDYRLVLYMLFTIFALPIMTELLLHGSLFQVLRQFGDTFAVIVVTLLASCMMHSIQDAVRAGIITFVISYFVIRTGSFWTAVLLHIVHEIYMFALFYIETFGNVYSLQWWMTVLLPCIVGVVAAVYMILHRPANGTELHRNITFLKLPDKIIAFFSSLPMIGFMVISIVLTIISAMISS